jgi:hypothetical protein
MGFPPEGIQVQVDLDGLKDLADQIRKMADRELVEPYDTARTALTSAPPFGLHAVMPVVRSERDLHKAAASQMLTSFDNYRRQAQALAAAIDSIVKQYGESDAYSAAKAGDIETGYSKALNEIKPAAGATPAQAPKSTGGREQL